MAGFSLFYFKELFNFCNPCKVGILLILKLLYLLKGIVKLVLDFSIWCIFQFYLFIFQALAKEQTYDNLDMTVVEALDKAEVCYILSLNHV